MNHKMRILLRGIPQLLLFSCVVGLLFINLVSGAFPPSVKLEWGKGWGSNEFDTPFMIVPGPNVDYFYTTGAVGQTASFGSVTLQVDRTSGYLMKHKRSNGDAVWAIPAKITSSSGFSYITSLVIDDTSSEIVYIVGYFDGDVTLGDFSLQSEDTAGFIAKYNADTKKFIWVTKISSSGSSSLRAATVFSVHLSKDKKQIYVGGYFSDTATFDSTGKFTVTSNGVMDVFFAVYDASTGNCLSVVTAGGSGDDRSFSSALDSSSSVIYMTGPFRNTVSFGPSITVTSSGGSDIYVAAYNISSGEFLWVIRAGGASFDESRFITTASDGFIYVTGYFQSQATFGPNITLTSLGSYDAFLAKIDPTDGSVVWVKQVGGTSSDDSYAVTSTSDGAVYMCGSFSSTVTLRSDLSLVSAGESDAFVIAFDSMNGNVLWAETVNSTSIDTCQSLFIDGKGAMYTLGDFSAPVRLSSSVSFTHNTYSDIYITKYSYEMCYGFAAGTSSACSGHGNCTSTDRCVCNIGYSGNQCQLFNCSGVSTCAPHGHCVAPDTCQCGEGWYGTNCSIPSCFSHLATDEQVCNNANGTCTNVDTCSCHEGYFGEECTNSICFSFNSTDSANVCGGHGNCVAKDICHCFDGYSGDDCSIGTHRSVSSPTVSSPQTHTSQSQDLPALASSDEINSTNRGYPSPHALLLLVIVYLSCLWIMC